MEIIRASKQGCYTTMTGYEIEWYFENNNWVIQFKTPKVYATESSIEVSTATFLTIRSIISDGLGYKDKGTLIDSFNKNVSFVNQVFETARLNAPFEVLMRR